VEEQVHPISRNERSGEDTICSLFTFQPARRQGAAPGGVYGGGIQPARRSARWCVRGRHPTRKAQRQGAVSFALIHARPCAPYPVPLIYAGPPAYPVYAGVRSARARAFDNLRDIRRFQNGM
jgi:hypothetical protein